METKEDILIGFLEQWVRDFLEKYEKGKREALHKIIELLSYENEDLSFVEFLVKVGKPIVKPLIEALAVCRNQASLPLIKALGEIGDSQAIYIIAKKLKDKDWRIRSEAALALGKIKHPNAVKVLIQALKDGNFAVRRNAAQALGEIKSKEATNALIKALGDNDWQVRSTAAWALGEIKDPEAVIPLIKRLKDRDREVVIKTIDALKNIKDPRATQALVEILTEKGEIRYKAIWALGEIKDPTAEEALTAALKDPDWRVQKKAEWALKRITGEEEEEKREPDIEL
ncbi:MAG: HEAT repeat domain-containing protein [Candidatus Jordarchaeaceae archaeon]